MTFGTIKVTFGTINGDFWYYTVPVNSICVGKVVEKVLITLKVTYGIIEKSLMDKNMLDLNIVLCYPFHT